MGESVSVECLCAFYEVQHARAPECARGKKEILFQKETFLRTWSWKHTREHELPSGLTCFVIVFLFCSFQETWESLAEHARKGWQHLHTGEYLERMCSSLLCRSSPTLSRHFFFHLTRGGQKELFLPIPPLANERPRGSPVIPNRSSTRMGQSWDKPQEHLLCAWEHCPNQNWVQTTRLGFSGPNLSLCLLFFRMPTFTVVYHLFCVRKVTEKNLANSSCWQWLSLGTRMPFCKENCLSAALLYLHCFRRKVLWRLWMRKAVLCQRRSWNSREVLSQRRSRQQNWMKCTHFTLAAWLLSVWLKKTPNAHD